MQTPQAHCRCGDCKLFGSITTKPDACGWNIPECKGAQSAFAKECALFTYPNGYQPLLDCPEEDLPEWTSAKQLSLEV